MSYTPTTWQTGDIVTSAKLNNIEQGIASGGVLVVNLDSDTSMLDKTWQEIADAPFAVIRASSSNGTKNAYITESMSTPSGYIIVTFGIELPADYTIGYYSAATADDYPVVFDPNGGGGGGES